MGTWGTGPFDNDVAADLVSFVSDAGPSGWKLVRNEFTARMLDAEAVVGAAEIVTLALGRGEKRDQRYLAFAVGRDNIGSWLRRYGSALPKDLPRLALSAVLAVSGEDLGWSNPANAKAWQSTVRSLIRRLEKSVVGALPFALIPPDPKRVRQAYAALGRKSRDTKKGKRRR